MQVIFDSVRKTSHLFMLICFFTVHSSIYPIQDETITEAGSVILACNASGMPSPMVSWVKVDGGERFNGSELLFTNINRSEAGEYRCEASNGCGNASEAARIFVQCKLTTVLIICPCNLPALMINFSLCNVCYELVQQQKLCSN